MTRRAYIKVDPETAALARSELSNLLAMLRAVYFVHQTAHWQVVGAPAYGNHLLFQRLYESVQEEIDTLAEKMVGLFGSAVVDLDQQLALIHAKAAGCFESDIHVSALRAEQSLQRALSTTYRKLKKLDALTLGMDDYLMATSSNHDTNVFLIQQVLATAKTAAAKSPITGESFFFDNPEKREVRELAQSRAISNSPAVAGAAAVENGDTRKEVRQEVALAKVAPPTPSEIKRQPGGGQFSTLNRFVVETAERTSPKVPQSRDDLPKHEVLDPSIGVTASFRSWTFAHKGK